MEKELLNLILQDFPESLIITFVCFSLLNLKLEWKKILFIALLEAVTNLVRHLPIAFGMHTVILILALSLYIRITTQARLSRIFTAVISCYVVMILTESIYVEPLLNLFSLSYQDVFSNPFLRASFSIPYFIAMLLLPAIKKLYFNFRQKKMSS